MDTPYRDPKRAIAERVDDLVSRMTLEEKLAQLGCAWSTQLVESGSFSESRARDCILSAIEFGYVRVRSSTCPNISIGKASQT